MLNTCPLASGLFRCQAEQMCIQVLRVAGPTFHVNSSRLLPTGQAQLLLSMKAMQQQQHSSLHLRKKMTCSFLVAISVQRVIKQLLLTPQQVLPKRSHEFLSI